MDVREGPCLCGQPEKMGEDADGKPVLIRCPLYQRLYVNAEGGEKKEEWKCAIAWTPILLIENRASTDAVASYMESFRNEIAKRISTAFSETGLVHRAGPIMRKELIEVVEARDAPPE